MTARGTNPPTLEAIIRQIVRDELANVGATKSYTSTGPLPPGMTIEKSHGKARPTLVRSAELRPINADVKPSEGRDASGRFAKGNRNGYGARFKATLRKSLGTRASEGEVLTVYRDALRVCAHTMRAMPSDAAPVRTLVVLHARHVALNAYFTAKAEAAGLDTEEGERLLQIADRQSQRAERVLVTALDTARVCATKTKPGQGSTVPWLVESNDG